jgi:hypothetical protein
MQTTLTTTGRRPLDQYFTPEPLAVACVHWLTRDGFYRGGTVLEPSSGRGAFVRAAKVAGGAPLITTVDIDPAMEDCRPLDVAGDHHVADFLDGRFGVHDLVIGNPPFSGAEAHVRHALAHRSEWGSVAFLLRLAFLESSARAPFWREHPASKVYVLSQRPSFTEGGTDSAAYGFFVWQRGWAGPSQIEVMSWY